MWMKHLTTVPGMALAIALGVALAINGTPSQAQQNAPAQGGGGGGRGGGRGFNLPPLLMETDAFPDGGIVPQKYAGRGGVQPAFKFSNAPAGTVAYAIIFHDLDVALQGGTGDVLHWIAWNIPASANGIPEGSLPPGSIQGNNITGQPNYMGPGAPAGPRYHHYVFELYALNAMLDLPATASRDDLLKAMQGKTTAKAAYVGRFRQGEAAAPAPQPNPPPGAAAAGRRGGGPPGGGPENGMNIRPPNGEGQKPAFAGQTRAPEQKLNVAFDVATVTEGLANPWGLAFLPDGKMLVTERPGRLRVVSADGKQLSEPVAGLPAVDARGQGGLLDVAIDPAFQKNQLIYWSYAEPGQGANNTAVARGKLVDSPAPKVENVQVIFHQAPSLDSPLHFGGRLVFNRDGTLFITTGDRSITEGRMQAQRMDGLLGKIVRINPDGSIPKDNPFVGKEGVRPEIWSIGHRNIQAATLNPATGELWEVEHGTRGGDELNVSRKGKDYGWPTIAYGIEYQGGPITGGIQQKEGMEQPRYYWDPVIAPSGMVFYTGKLFPAWQNSLFIGGMGSTNLVRLTLKGEQVVGEERLLQDLQPQRERIRDVRQGPDGAIYLLTDSPKGRILKLVPKA